MSRAQDEKTLAMITSIIENAISNHCRGDDMWLCAFIAAKRILSMTKESTKIDRDHSFLETMQEDKK